MDFNSPLLLGSTVKYNESRGGLDDEQQLKWGRGVREQVRAREGKITSAMSISVVDGTYHLYWRKQPSSLPF